MVASIATAALIVACLLAFVLHGAVLVAWARRQIVQRREARAEARWGRLFTRAAVGVDLDAPWKVRRREAVVVLELWIRRRDAVTNPGTLVTVARHVGLHAHARRLVRRRHGRAQMAGVVALGWLGDEGDVELLERMARRGEEPMATAALASLVRLDSPAAFPFLRRELRAGPQALPAVVTAALAQNDTTGGLAELIRSEATVHAAEMPGLLRIIGLRRDERGLGAVRSVLVHAEAPVEALAAALHTLADIGRPSDVVFAVRMLQHDNWAVRVRAVHAVARLGGKAYIDRLVPLLADPDPWVRRRAAEAVVATKSAVVDTSALSEEARLAFEEALTARTLVA